MLQPVRLFHGGSNVPGGDLLPGHDVPLCSHLHDLGVGVDVVHCVAVAVAVHERVQWIETSAINIALRQTAGIH